MSHSVQRVLIFADTDRHRFLRQVECISSCSLSAHVRGHCTTGYCLAVSADGTRAYHSCCEDGHVHVLDLRSAQRLYTFAPQFRMVWALAPSLDDRYLFVADVNATVVQLALPRAFTVASGACAGADSAEEEEERPAVLKTNVVRIISLPCQVETDIEGLDSYETWIGVCALGDGGLAVCLRTQSCVFIYQ